jgi:hypothetical protein
VVNTIPSLLVVIPTEPVAVELPVRVAVDVPVVVPEIVPVPGVEVVTMVDPCESVVVMTVGLPAALLLPPPALPPPLVLPDELTTKLIRPTVILHHAPELDRGD